MQLKNESSADDAARAAAHLFTDWVSKSEREKLCVALAGGSTPGALYRLLASEEFRSQIPWQKIHWFLGDERCVALDHEDSNFRMIRETLLDPAEVPETRRHPVRCAEGNPGDAALAYEDELRATCSTSDTGHPIFDIMILGMGADVHTASLFPETIALKETERAVVANRVPKLNAWRITVTPPLIQAARQVILLATGAEKKEALQTLLHADRNEQLYPAQLLRHRNPERTVVIADQAALRSPIS